MENNSEILSGLVLKRIRDGRCRYDPQVKQELVKRCLQPGVSVAALAMQHGVNANLPAAVTQTRSYLTWPDTNLTKTVNRGAEMTELLKSRLPAPFNVWAAVDTEFGPNVVKAVPGR